MKIVDIDVDNIVLEEVKGLHLCLGYFDGIHLGHQEIIKAALNDGLTGVMTFDVPPNFALRKNIVNCCLTSLYEKSNFLEKMGVKYLYILRMSKNLLNMTRDENANVIAYEDKKTIKKNRKIAKKQSRLDKKEQRKSKKQDQ